MRYLWGLPVSVGFVLSLQCPTFLDAFSTPITQVKIRQSRMLSLRVADSISRVSEQTSSDGRDEDYKITPTPRTALTSPPKLDNNVSKFRCLKDYMWIRETLEDLTAVEFACSVEAAEEVESGQKRKRAVDYEKLLAKLNVRIRDMLGPNFEPANGSDQPELTEGKGMGRVVYSQEQRMDLLK
jgi:hypothetical protein